MYSLRNRRKHIVGKIVLVMICFVCLTISLCSCGVDTEQEIRDILINGILDFDPQYCESSEYNDDVFSKYIDNDNIETSKIYVYDENTIIQYYISAETNEGCGVIFRRIYSKVEPEFYSVVKLYHSGVIPYGINAVYPHSHFYVWVTLDRNCKPSRDLPFLTVNAENYEIFEINYGEDIIQELHNIYLDNTNKLLNDFRSEDK